MAKLKANRSLQLIILLLTCATSGLVGFAFRSSEKPINTVSRLSPTQYQQLDEKVIELKNFPGEPYKYDDLSVKKNKLTPGQKFSSLSMAEKAGGSAGDWLENLEFTLKNNWEKKITYLRFEFDFLETRVGRPMMVYQTSLGVPPNAPENVKKFRKPFSLGPGEVYHYMLSEQELKNIKKFLANGTFQLENLSKLSIRVGDIIYDDGMRWSQVWYKPNLSYPGGYEKIN
jgi:hypothetical protein